MARTESIHSIRRIESKIKKDFNSLWFEIYLDFYSFWFAIQFDFINFDSVRFWYVANQKLKVGEAWFTHCRIIGCFDFEYKANQSESRIKLVWALIDTESLSIWSLPYCLLKNSLRTGELPVWFSPINSVSTGLLLGVLLLHLIPDANGDTAEALEDFGATTNYPVSMLLVGVGFFIVTLVELLVERCNEKGKN